MLQQIRDPRFMKSGMWIILIITIPSFVLFYGFGASGGADQNIVSGPLVKVETDSGTVELDRNDLQRMQQEATNHYLQVAGQIGYQGLSQGMIAGSLTPKEIAEFAVSEIALEERADKQQIRVSNEQVAEILRSSGTTDEMLRSYLRSAGITEHQYVQMRKSELKANILEQSVSRIARPSLLELWNEYLLQNESLDIAYARIPVEATGDFDVSEEEIRTAYNEMIDAEDPLVMLPERRSYRAVALKVPFERTPQPTEDEIFEAWENLGDDDAELSTEGGISLRHVLIPVVPTAPEADLAAARAEAERALSRIQSGEDFATVADEMTGDIRNVEFVNQFTTPSLRGGLLPEMVSGFESDIWGAEYMDWVRAGNEGDVSAVIATPQGFVVSRIEEAVAPGKVPFEEARPVLQQRLRSEAASRVADERNKKVEANRVLLTTAREQHTTLEDIAAAVGADVILTSPTPVSTTGIPSVGFFRDTAGARISGLVPGIMTDALTATDNTVAIIEIDEEIPAGVKDMDVPLRSRIEAKVRRDKALAFAKEEAERFKAMVSDSDNVTTVGLANELTAETLTAVKRSAVPAPFSQLRDVNDELAKVEAGDLLILENGQEGMENSVFLIQVLNVDEPGREEFLGSLSDLERGFLMNKRRAYVQDFRKDAIKSMDAWFNPDYVEPPELGPRERRRLERERRERASR